MTRPWTQQGGVHTAVKIKSALPIVCWRGSLHIPLSPSLTRGSEYLLLCHQTIHIMISPTQPPLLQIAVPKQHALQTKSNNEHIRGKQARLLLQKGKMKTVWLLLAFFQGLCKFHFTICSLELIKKRTGLDFVVYTFLQLRNDNAVFGWSPHFKD